MFEKLNRKFSMNREMEIGIRLHRRLSGQNDVLDNELLWKMNNITKEQSRRCAVIDSEVKLLKKQLHVMRSFEKSKRKTNIQVDEDIMAVRDWDRPSPVVLKARMMIKTGKSTRLQVSSETRCRTEAKHIPEKLVRLDDLPRIRYEIIHKQNVDNSEREDRSVIIRPETVPVFIGCHINDSEQKELGHRNNSVPKLQQCNNDQKLHHPSLEVINNNPKAGSYGQRRASVNLDNCGFEFMNMTWIVPSQNSRRRSLPNLHSKKESEHILEGSGAIGPLDLHFTKNRVPSNSERRIQMKRSSVYQIYKFLTDALPNMSNQEIADIRKNRQQ